jgi:hypothetical protein
MRSRPGCRSGHWPAGPGPVQECSRPVRVEPGHCSHGPSSPVTVPRAQSRSLEPSHGPSSPVTVPRAQSRPRVPGWTGGEVTRYHRASSVALVHDSDFRLNQPPWRHPNESGYQYRKELSIQYAFRHATAHCRAPQSRAARHPGMRHTTSRHRSLPDA